MSKIGGPNLQAVDAFSKAKGWKPATLSLFHSGSRVWEPSSSRKKYEKKYCCNVCCLVTKSKKVA